MKWKAAYPEYKDSGIEWLGEIPTHWEVVRLKYHAQFDKSGIWGAEPETCDAPIPVARTADISIDGDINFQDMPMRCLSAAEVRAYKCRLGKIIVVKSSGSVSNVVTGKAALVTQEMPTFSFSNFLLRVIPNQVVWDSRFLYAFLTSHMVRKRIELMVSGTTYPNLKVSEYRGFEVPLPNRLEQQVIADFLDRETAKIDALVEKKERLIELLKEKRTALISHVVTKGLDPNVPMKDSGIEWLGKIPAHWGIRKLNYVGRFIGGGTPAKGEINYWKGDIPWVSPKDMHTSLVADTLDHITEEAIRESATSVVPAGSVLIVVRSGILQHTIPVAIAERNVALNQDMKAFVSKQKAFSRYLMYLIEGKEKDLLVIWRKEGATVESIDFARLCRTYVPLPAEEEQQAIVNFLDREKARIDALIAKIEEAIKLLKEYHTALISAAVTGKIDVRNTLPEPSQT